MVRAPGVRVPASEAERTRRRLAADGTLRTDLYVGREDGDIVFPVSDEGAPAFDFRPRDEAPKSYQELLPERLRGDAPRAFDVLGEIAIVKVPPGLQAEAAAIGEALLAFVPGCRAVFHDNGVKGKFRVRDLHRIAGGGGTATTIQENGLRLQVDPGRAYFSPRLAEERAREAALINAGEHVVDLFGGIGALAILAATRGARVTCIDLNPDACDLARDNVAQNGVADAVTIVADDARAAGPAAAPAHRIVMNLPHGAAAFLDTAAATLGATGTIHLHEIMEADAQADREAAILQALIDAGRTARIVARRVVRAYSTTQRHMVFDIEVTS